MRDEYEAMAEVLNVFGVSMAEAAEACGRMGIAFDGAHARMVLDEARRNRRVESAPLSASVPRRAITFGKIPREV